MAGLGIFGCNLDTNFSGLGESLLDPEPQAIETPGQRLQAGERFGHQVVSSETGNRYVVARTPARELSIFNLATQHECTIPDVVSYDRFEFEGLPTMIAVLMGAPESQTEVGFSDFECRLNDVRLPFNSVDDLDARLVSSAEAPSSVALLLRLPNSAITLIDPWSGYERVVEPNATSAPVFALGSWWWYVGGQLVRNDRTFAPVATLGTTVREMTFSVGDTEELAFVDRTPDGDQLYVARPPEFEAELLETDACGIGYAAGRVLFYFQPCESRTLVMQDRTTGEARVVASDVVRGRGGAAARLVNDQGLLYLTNPDPLAGRGTLWLAREDGSEPVAIGENAPLSQFRFTPDGGLITFVDSDGTSSRLIYWKDGTATTIAERALQLGTRSVIANYDGVVGDLMRLGPDFSVELVANRVEPRSFVGNAFLRDFADGTGTLVVMDEDSGELEPLASGVPPQAYRFGVQFEGMILLGNRDAATNTYSLIVRLFDSGQTFEVNKGVTEFAEVSFPSRGVMYNSLSSDQPGIWFAKLI